MRRPRAEILCMRMLWPIVWLLALSLAAVAKGQTSYTFINIADSSGPFRSFLEASSATPTVNNSGVVAFQAFYENGGEGVYIGGGGPLTPIVERLAGDPSPLGLSTWPQVPINDSGTVAFKTDGTPDGRIFTSNGGPRTVIAGETAPIRDLNHATVSMNASGTVVFGAGTNTALEILTGSGGPLTKIADNTGPLGSLIGFPDINSSGVVAFSANLDGVSGNPQRIYTGSGGPITLIADAGTDGVYPYFNNAPSINDAGTVAFSAALEGDRYVIFTSSGGDSTTIADTAGPFSFFPGGYYGPTINNAGNVAFEARLDAGWYGIFNGPDPVLNKVIRTGEGLFGSTLTNLRFQGGLNDRGDVAFVYQLSNGVSGIALAQVVPEPSTNGVLSVLLALALFRKRRRRGRVDRVG